MTTPPETVDHATPDLPDEPAARLERLVILISDQTLDVHVRLQFNIEGCQLSEQLGRSDLGARFLYGQAQCYFLLANYSRSCELMLQSEKAYRLLGEVVKATYAQGSLGRTCVQMGEYGEAMSHLTGALETARQLDEPRLESFVLSALGGLYKQLGDYESAMSNYLQGLAIDEQINDRKFIAEKLGNLGWISEALGDPHGAIDYYQRSQAIYRDLGNSYGEARTLYGLGNVYVMLGEYRRAIDSYTETLELAIGIGGQQSEAQALSGIGRAYMEMGELSQALDWLQRSLEIREQIGDQRGILDMLVDIQRVCLKQGETGKAYEQLSRAKEIALRMNASPAIARVDLALSEYYEQTGDAARALEHFKEYYRIEADIIREDTATKLKRARAQIELEKESAIARLKSERMAHELDVARRVQLSLLPTDAPGIVGLDIASICLPALEVGGDYYDFFPFADQRLAIAIGDITGKGIPAAIHMTLVKGVLLSYAAPDAMPKDVLTSVNHHVYASFSRGWFASIIYAVIDVDDMRLDYVCSGHNPLLVLRSGECISPERTRGMALGLASSATFAKSVTEQSVALMPGDTIVLYTDGYTEAMNGVQEEYGDERFIAAACRHSSLAEAASIIAAIGKDVEAFIGGAQQHDDMTMVVVKVR